jgi:hypothetical protein
VTEANQRLMQRVSIWLINSLDENQQARMVERLSDLAEDFRELAQQPLRSPRGMPPPCLVDCAGSGS